MGSADKAVHAWVDGRVQGVGFRYSTQQSARELGLSGWVRNTSDGRVEVFFQGPSDAVGSMLSWLRQGPAMARVDSCDYDFVPLRNLKGFAIRA